MKYYTGIILSLAISLCATNATAKGWHNPFESGIDCYQNACSDTVKKQQ